MECPVPCRLQPVWRVFPCRGYQTPRPAVGRAGEAVPLSVLTVPPRPRQHGRPLLRAPLGVAMPTIGPKLRKVPRHDAVPYDDDLAAIKERAARAWREVKAKSPNLIPPVVADRIWVNALTSVDGAPPRVRATMLHRVEIVFLLLVDQGRWSALGPPPPPRRRA
jgi:hypothetical protein